MLLELLARPGVKEGTLVHGEYRPGVTIRDRTFWDGVDPRTRQFWKRCGEKYLAFDWPPLTTEMYAGYQRTGERRGFELPYHQRRQTVTMLALAEGFENEGRFLPSLCAGLEQICREPTWVVPAHHDGPAPDYETGATCDPGVDIFAAETGNLLAWVLHVLEEGLLDVNPDCVRQTRREIRRRVIEPYLKRTDFWWMGYNDEDIGNWTTWCTSNCLGTILLEERDPRRRLQGIEKACYSLTRFLEAHREDGGCDEGPMYWNFAGACLFDSLEMLQAASGGAFGLFRHPAIRNIATYISKVHIHDLYFVNFADCPPQFLADGALIYRFGTQIGDHEMRALGAHLYRKLEDRDPEFTVLLKMYRALASLRDDSVLRSFAPAVSHSRDVYLDRIQVVVSRQFSRTDKGLLVAVKGGHNQEGHNHNDVGNLIVYLNGQPGVIDVGMAEYTKDSFNHKRYDSWVMQSAYHNVPLINGVMQQNGPSFKASEARYLRDGQTVNFSLDISGAYPEEAGIELWERECILDRSQGEIRIRESFRFRKDGNGFELRYMTCRHPRLDGKSVRFDVGEGTALVLDTQPEATDLTLHTIPLDDRQLSRAWGTELFQIRLRFDDVPRQSQCITRLRPVLASMPSRGNGQP
jgi:hypothetical protein